MIERDEQKGSEEHVGGTAVSERPSLLCAGVRGERRGLWLGLAAVFSTQTHPTHRTRVVLHTRKDKKSEH